MPIDWWRVSASVVWIVGFSVVLATCSYHAWRAAERGRRIFQYLLSERSFRVWLAGGMFLICGGWAAAHPDGGWRRWLWIALASGFAGEILRQYRRRPKVFEERTSNDTSG